jgi:hypothetical protein
MKERIVGHCFCGKKLTPDRGNGEVVFWECKYCGWTLEFMNKEEAAEWETKENLESDNQSK